jgi:hypothetical protein
MAREIVTERDVQRERIREQGAGELAAGGKPAAPKAPDSYTERLLKNIPAEVVATYVAFAGVIRAAGAGSPDWMPWAVFWFLAIGTPVYLNRVQGVRKPLQLAIATGAFAVWVFSLGDQSPFTTQPWFRPIYPALLLPAYTFTLAFLKPEAKGS